MGNCIKAIAPLFILFLLIIASTPVVSSSQPTKVVAISAGIFHSAAISDDGTVWAWGDNRWGQLGDGTNVTRLTPVQIPISNVKASAAAFDSTFVLKNDGTVWAWGNNEWGQLGDGTNKSSYVPIPVKGLSHVKAIAAGAGHVLALKDDGTIWAWGRGFRGELGIDSVNPAMDNQDIYNLYTPTGVPVSNVIAISAGAFHSAALKADGTLWEWGEGGEGQLGNGKLENQYSPMQVPIAGVKAIACGDSVTLALKNDGTLWSWGLNLDYRLGNMTTDERQATPIKANWINDIAAISAGSTTLVLKSDGTVWHWGRDGIDPVMVKGLSGITAISAGDQCGLALKNDGTVWAWGSDDYGQLGDGGNLAAIIGSDGVIRNYNGTIRPPYTLFENGPVQAYIGTQTGPASAISTSAIRPTQEPYVPQTGPAIAPINASAKVVEKWKLQNSGRIDYLGAGDNGLLYAFSNNNITCLDQDGAPRWNVTVPDKWRICSDWCRVKSFNMNMGLTQLVTSQPIYDSEDGYLYVYATPNSPLLDPLNFRVYTSANNTSGLSWAVLAITPDGRIGWELPLTTNVTRYDTTSIKAYGGRVYVFHDYSETVLGRNGTIIFTIPNVSDPAAVDENGRLYVSQALRVNWSGNDLGGDAGYTDFRVASGLIKAYDDEGRQLWQKDVGGIIPVQYVVEEVRQKYGSMPLYQDGIVYVPVSNGVVALDVNGNEKWSKRFEYNNLKFFELMPLDAADNVYLASDNLADQTTGIYMIDRNGTQIAPLRTLKIYYDGARHSSAKDGIVYDIEMDRDKIGRSTSMDDIATATIRAYDIKGDRYLWNYTLPTNPRYTVILDASNLYALFDSMTADQYVKGDSGQANTATPQIIGSTWVYTYPTDGTLYINFKSMRHGWPVVLGQTRCIYTSGLYALDTSGFVVCQKPVGSIITAMAVNNSTVYYGTGDGGISAMTIGIASVIAIGASLILFIGYIARSRSRLNKNMNRNSVMEYISQNPGSTLYEISRGIGMNKGTVRYHLLILGLNHRITSYNDSKFVRYFLNSNAYSKEERVLISLIRRDTMRKVLRALLEKPGMTSAEMGKTLGQPDSAIRKHLNELCAKGIALRENISDRRYAYSIKSDRVAQIGGLMKSLGGENASTVPINSPAEA